MIRTDIKIIRMHCATLIHTPKTFVSYDHIAGEENMPIQCIMSFRPEKAFTDTLEKSKIITIKERNGYKNINYPFSQFLFTPQFGYTNQKLEDIICELLEKYNL